MAKIHILEKNNKSYRIVIHFAVPAGNNSVGKSWKAVGLASGKTGSTCLEVGTEPSNITQAEYDNILAGDIIEIVKTIDTPANNVAVEALADILIDEYKANMNNSLQHFGHTIT